MQHSRADCINHIRNRKKKSSKCTRKKGSVYKRGNKLWVSFQYLGKKMREPSGLNDIPENRSELRKMLDLIVAEIEMEVFDFSLRFPHSKRKELIASLEGKTVTTQPDEVTFGFYYRRWWKDMAPEMTTSQLRDYKSIISYHLLPFWESISFSEITAVKMKKFIGEIKNKKNRQGNRLSAKRIHNILIPLRTIISDAEEEYGWVINDPFRKLKLSKPQKTRVQPFNFDEWNILIENINPWYRPYFQFAVQTGLRPSEQVGLKWKAIDDEYIHIELSRVRNKEKSELKNEYSRRMIALRKSLKETLAEQKKLLQKNGMGDSPYVFLNTEGRPILQDKLRELWHRAIKKSGLSYRRMYETRHTFASWALSQGETPGWVAKTLGHVDTSMVFGTYNRFIPNLKRQDGSALEQCFSGPKTKNGNPSVTI